MTIFHSFQEDYDYTGIERDKVLRLEPTTLPLLEPLSISIGEKLTRTATAIMYDLAIKGDWVSYSRNTSHYTGRSGSLYTYASVLNAVAKLDRYGLIEHDRKPKGKSPGLQSRMRANPALIALVRNALQATDGLRAHSTRGGIILRGPDKLELPLPGTRAIERMCRQVHTVNEMICTSPTPAFVRAPGCRIFNVDLNHGGRFYCPYQNFRKKALKEGQSWAGFWRHDITFDGKPHAEADYVAMHVTMLYEKAGAVMPSDPYIVEGMANELAPRLRDLGKLALNTMINARTLPDAVGSIMKAESFVETVGQYQRNKAQRLVDGLIRLNEPIRRYLCTGVGIDLQAEDSSIMMAVCMKAAKSGVTVLPVHDAVLCAANDLGWAQDAMEEAAHKAGYIRMRVKAEAA